MYHFNEENMQQKLAVYKLFHDPRRKRFFGMWGEHGELYP